MEPRYTNDESLPKLVADLANLKREGSYWDFKREWHENKADLLHDIICMANNPEDTTGLLIIGINEEEDFQPTGDVNLLGERRNTQSIVNMLRAKHWADGIPKVRVASIKLGNACIDVVLIDHDSESLPYYLTVDYGEGRSVVRAGAVYTRNADNNTQKRRRPTRSRPSDFGVGILVWTKRHLRGSLSCCPSLPNGFIPFLF